MNSVEIPVSKQRYKNAILNMQDKRRDLMSVYQNYVMIFIEMSSF